MSKAKRFWLTSAPGLTIVNPKTGAFLKKEGESCPNNDFWRRRLLDKDVVEVERPSAKPAKTAKPANTGKGE